MHVYFTTFNFAIYKSITLKQKKYRDFSRYLMVAGAGFEPYDLRVMSPMSYQTALPRDKALACASVFWCLYMIHHTWPFVKGFCQTIACFLRKICLFLTKPALSLHFGILLSAHYKKLTNASLLCQRQHLLKILTRGVFCGIMTAVEYKGLEKK